MAEIDANDLVLQVLETARRLGAEEAEVYFENSRELTIEVAKQEIETLKVAEDRGLGLRVLVGDRMGFAYTSDISLPSLEELAKRALANARKASGDAYNCLPRPASHYPWVDTYDPKIQQVPLEEKIELAREVERQARGFDKRVAVTETCSYQDSSYLVTLANSHGLRLSYQGAFCGLFAYMVAREGADSQTGFGFQYGLHYQDLDPVKVGREAGEKAVRMLGAKPVNTVQVPVVLDPYVATSFLGLLSGSLSAEAVQKGKSQLAGRVGEKVASELITIIDDGARPGGIVSAPFDGEGVPTSKTVLIEEGRLRGFLHNTYTAAKDGVVSTGNARRGSFKGTPEVGITNFYIAPGKTPRQKLLDQVDNGFYVTEILGMHTANPISGDFSLGAAGLWLEKGQFSRPVRGVAIAGNILELLQAVDAVGDDLTFFVGKGSPTIRISQMTVSGS